VALIGGVLFLPSAAAADPTFGVMNASGGIYWRSGPDWNTAVAVAGNGFYPGTVIAVSCYQAGAGNVPGSTDTMWEKASWVSGPGTGSGWINEHFINDGAAINQPSPGVPACGAAPPPPPPPLPSGQFSVMNASGGIYWRSGPDWNTAVAVAGNGFYPGTVIAISCYQGGAGNVPGSPDTMWEKASWVSGPGTGSGWINEHFINDGAAINQPSPGIPPCTSSPGGSAGGDVPGGNEPGAPGPADGTPGGSTSSPTPRYIEPCAAAYRGGSSHKFSGGRLIYDRKESLLRVCQGFGTQGSGVDVKWLNAGMKCALISAATPSKYAALSFAVDDACGAHELATHPGAVAAIGSVCGLASDFLGLALKVVGKISGLACAAAPSVGRTLANRLEGNHEYHVAKDIIHTKRCLEFRQYFGVSSWHAVSCR